MSKGVGYVCSDFCFGSFPTKTLFIPAQDWQRGGEQARQVRQASREAAAGISVRTPPSPLSCEPSAQNPQLFISHFSRNQFVETETLVVIETGNLVAIETATPVSSESANLPATETATPISSETANPFVIETETRFQQDSKPTCHRDRPSPWPPTSWPPIPPHCGRL